MFLCVIGSYKSDKNDNPDISFSKRGKVKGESGIDGYALISMAQVNGYTVKNYVPVIPEDERKEIINDQIVRLLNEYNKLESGKPKNI